MDTERETVLITGVTGFIGSHVVNEVLKNDGFQVVAPVRNAKAYKNVEVLQRQGVALIEGNFFDPRLIEAIFDRYPVNNIIHIAALRGIGIGSAQECMEVNLRGTERLLEGALSHGVKKFIFCSSVGVLGTIPTELPGGVHSRVNGDNAYHKSKILAEEKVCSFIDKGLNAFIVRPAITYGEGDMGFPAVLVKLIRKRALLLSSKNIQVHLLSVSKLAEIFLKILTCESLKEKTFIAADKSPIGLRELTNLVYAYYHGKPYPRIMTIPQAVCSAMLLSFRLLGNEKWYARMQLLSQDWYYSVDEIQSALHISLANTKEDFPKFLSGVN
ncbi:NAD-dependent epimerase/dehydratase family protein [Syntrophorhabdus aromaticivorans]|uniref:NAD(P)-dependent oxidoreductase n=1 Tax=Syntrophorhabdus aromaticivorans TaxID=328301 RepID=A0A351U0U2_9BACT|nr:NAD(P)-dependent oxidoreductase [Syntrophorhabdus aromaticivorans]NLW35008.1 NAD(P)-dependent oxidoreductase [Syntrophorhabdus aromaticivorans]HBA53573.1 NAD(P)-dependent oxidoreductase [Syntrophorhabdus aromaticivorans]